MKYFVYFSKFYLKGKILSKSPHLENSSSFSTITSCSSSLNAFSPFNSLCPRIFYGLNTGFLLHSATSSFSCFFESKSLSIVLLDSLTWTPILPHFSSSSSLLSLLLVKGIIPRILKISESSEVFIFLSKGELEDKLGRTLTSRSQGLRFESIITSKP